MINRLNERFAQVNNEVLWNKNISLKAKWLYAYLCSCKDDWKFSVNWLTSVLMEWERSIKSWLKELVEANCLLRFSVKVNWKFCWWEWIVNPTAEDLQKYNDPCNRTVTFTDSAETAPSQNSTENNNTKLNNTNSNNTNSICEKWFSSLKEWSSSKNPPSSARPPKQAGIDKFGMSKALIDLCPSCDREPNFLLKRIEEWLALDTRENILTWYTNYCKKYWKSSQRPTTIIKNWEYKQYIEEKVKPSKLTKYEERLNNPTWRSHPTVDRQYKWLLDEEYEEYSTLSMDYYWEVMQENKFIWYPL